MAEFLTYRILDGKLAFEKVPKCLKADVKAVLTDLGNPELAKGSEVNE